MTKPKVRAYPSGKVRTLADQIAAGAVPPRRAKGAAMEAKRG